MFPGQQLMPVLSGNSGRNSCRSVPVVTVNPQPDDKLRERVWFAKILAD